MYKVYYMNVYCKSFHDRDDALEFILFDSNKNRRAWGDYEILDRSDFL